MPKLSAHLPPVALTDLVSDLHHAFYTALRQDLGRKKLKAVMAENRRRRLADPGDNSCASHDHVDANMTMAEAFKWAVGREFDVCDEDECSLWNAAWNRFAVDCVSATEASLSAEYETYLAAEKLPGECAEELLAGDEPDHRQRVWLTGFTFRWEAIVY